MSSSGSAVVKAETQGGVVEAEREWSLPARFAFRFGFCYLILFLYPSFLGWRGSQDDHNNLVRKMWDHVVPWVGSHLLHLPGPFAPVPRESGDQLYDYIAWLCIFFTALIAATAWSFLDRNRKQYWNLYEWMRVLVRLTLAIVMLNYGMGKVFRAQFPELSLSKLVDTFGRSSPQELLWAFMKYSQGYGFFGGLGEVAGAVLLIVPRFTALGSLITLAMASNVLMLNVFYDVPRKILCFHLLLMCLFLLLPDVRRLFGFFVLGRNEQLSAPRPLFRDKWFNHAALVFQLALGLGMVLYFAHISYVNSARRAVHVDANLRGIWNVDQFTVDGSPRPPLLTDTTRWQRVILDWPGLFTIQLMDNTQQEFLVQWNPQKTRGFLWAGDHTMKGSLSVDNLQGDHMVLGGEIDGHRVEAQLRRMDPSDPVNLLLTNRGFHWVN